ncbi:hypothetical protein CEXT_767551 [Caerostris extrusa]|uniref:Uncharacterized protein n=1 Tax=Caerostris extrusa TaxID=172846 RepID=A0AAV4XFW4_CAEEX|nr:hypothetical protein CEXT_767551 [Caerostris extrusa]
MYSFNAYLKSNSWDSQGCLMKHGGEQNFFGAVPNEGSLENSAPSDWRRLTVFACLLHSLWEVRRERAVGVKLRVLGVNRVNLEKSKFKYMFGTPLFINSFLLPPLLQIVTLHSTIPAKIKRFNCIHNSELLELCFEPWNGNADFLVSALQLRAIAFRCFSPIILDWHATRRS